MFRAFSETCVQEISPGETALPIFWSQPFAEEVRKLPFCVRKLPFFLRNSRTYVIQQGQVRRTPLYAQQGTEDTWVAFVTFSPRDGLFSLPLIRRLTEHPQAGDVYSLSLEQQRTVQALLKPQMCELLYGIGATETEPFSRYRPDELHVPYDVSTDPPTTEQARDYLALRTPPGHIILLDTPLEQAAAQHYHALGWQVMRVTLSRTIHGYYHITDVVGYEHQPSEAALQEAFERYLPSHPWGRGERSGEDHPDVDEVPSGVLCYRIKAQDMGTLIELPTEPDILLDYISEHVQSGEMAPWQGPFTDDDLQYLWQNDAVPQVVKLRLRGGDVPEVLEVWELYTDYGLELRGTEDRVLTNRECINIQNMITHAPVR